MENGSPLWTYILNTSRWCLCFSVSIILYTSLHKLFEYSNSALTGKAEKREPQGLRLALRSGSVRYLSQAALTSPAPQKTIKHQYVLLSDSQVFSYKCLLISINRCCSPVVFAIKVLKLLSLCQCLWMPNSSCADSHFLLLHVSSC